MPTISIIGHYKILTIKTIDVLNEGIYMYAPNKGRMWRNSVYSYANNFNANLRQHKIIRSPIIITIITNQF